MTPPAPRRPARHNTGNLVPRALMEKGPRGFPLCRWCRRETSAAAYTFCGPACVHEWKLRSDAGYLRGALFERDRGVCVTCGTDTVRLAARVRALVPCRDSGAGYAGTGGVEPVFARHVALLKARGYDVGRSLWAADHILPVAEGGGQCDLHNIQTLCVPCHKAKSRAETQRRALARRAARTRP